MATDQLMATFELVNFYINGAQILTKYYFSYLFNHMNTLWACLNTWCKQS